MACVSSGLIGMKGQKLAASGPYFQTERLELYHKYVQQLMEVGRL